MSAVERSFAWAASAAGGRLEGAGERVFRGLAIDSRRVAAGNLFVALPGERADGHEFVADALVRGAAGALVQRGVERPAGHGTAPLLIVPDTLEALHALTRRVRAARTGRVVGITGSAGKTTTKELLAAMLGARYSVAKTPGNLNNLLGFPLTLFNAEEDAQWLVAEMGISLPGEMDRLARLVRPHAAVITNVGDAHLEFFGTRRAIAEEKGRLLADLEAPGIFVANALDPEVERLARRHAGPVIRFAAGAGADAEVRSSEVRLDAAGATCFTVRAPGEEAEFRLRLLGEHNVENATAAAAAAVALGVPLAEAAAAASQVDAGAHRGVLRRVDAGSGSALVLDDCYNSNPAALDRALTAAARLPGRRHWAVLGEMRELGAGSPAFHRAAGVRAAAMGFEPVVAVGELARELAAGAGDRSRWFPDATAAAAWAPGELRAEDVVLVKGSRGVGLEVVADALAGAAAPAAAAPAAAAPAEGGG